MGLGRGELDIEGDAAGAFVAVSLCLGVLQPYIIGNGRSYKRLERYFPILLGRKPLGNALP